MKSYFDVIVSSVSSVKCEILDVNTPLFVSLGHIFVMLILRKGGPLPQALAGGWLLNVQFVYLRCCPGLELHLKESKRWN